MMASFEKLAHRRVILGLVLGCLLAALPVCLLSLHAISICRHNGQVQKDWSAWLGSRKGPPSYWQVPSNSLVRFQDKSKTHTSRDGLTSSLWGYKNIDGSIAVEPRFSSCAKRFYGGLAWANDPGAGVSGYIHPDGSWAIIVPGTAVSHISSGMAKFQVIDEFGYPHQGFVNRRGEVVVPPELVASHWYVDGYVLAYKETLVGNLVRKVETLTHTRINFCASSRAIIYDDTGAVADLPRRPGAP